MGQGCRQLFAGGRSKTAALRLLHAAARWEARSASVPILEYYLSFDDRDVRFGYPTAELTRTPHPVVQKFEHAAIVATGSGADFSFTVDAGDKRSECSLT